MRKLIRFLAPAAVAMALGLAGCKTAPGGARGEDGAAAAGAQGGQQAAAAGAPAGQPGAAPAPDAAAARVMPVEFFIAQLEPGAGLQELKLSDGSIYVQQAPVLTRNDLAEAAAMVDKEGQHFVGLRFNEAGARRLADVSGQNLGKLMVLAVNREMVAAPRIAEPLDRGVLAFRVGSQQEAAEIAAAIRGEPAGAAQGQPPTGQ